VRAVLARRSVKEIKRVREKRDGEQEAAQASKEVHLAILGLCHRVPRLIVLHVAMVGVVSAVRDTPAMVRDEDGRVDDVANKVVERFVSTEALVAAVVSNNEQSPEHGALSEPIEGPHQRVVHGVGAKCKTSHDGNVQGEISK